MRIVHAVVAISAAAAAGLGVSAALAQQKTPPASSVVVYKSPT